MDSDAHACPVCGQAVDTVVRRHKTLGAWVPVWVAGPCRNPDCAAYAEQGAEGDEAGTRPRTGEAGNHRGGAGNRPGAENPASAEPPRTVTGESAAKNP